MTSIKQTLIDRSVPQYIKSEYPLFSLFMEAYYEFCESQGRSIEYVTNLKNHRNIDTTLTEFLSYFQKEYISKFPQSVLADKRILINNIRSFYINKGNQQSYKFLFKVLYNEDISFYFPGDDILRSSDGKWVKRTIIKVKVNNVSDVKNKEGLYILGKTSGATAGIESIIVYTERSILVAEIDLSSISGLFVSGEHVDIGGSDFETIECYSTAIVTSLGSGYAVGDVIPIRNSLDDSIGLAKIYNTTRGNISNLTIVDGGVGYNGNIKLIDDFSYLPINYTWSSMVLNNTPMYSSVGYDFSVQPINFTVPDETFLGVGDIINVIDSSNSSGSGAYGIVTSVNKFGEVLTISLLDAGEGYETPTTHVQSNTGSGAIINVSGGGGGVKTVRLITFPVVTNPDSGVYIDFTNKGDGLASALLSSNIQSTYPGYWLNEDGQLSSNKKLQDNYFFQDFSYVIKVSKSIDEWADHIKDIIHPLGTKVFGEIEILSTVSMSLSVPSIITDFVLNFDLSITTTVEDIEITTSTFSLMSWGNTTTSSWADNTDIKWSV